MREISVFMKFRSRHFCYDPLPLEINAGYAHSLLQNLLEISLGVFPF